MGTDLRITAVSIDVRRGNEAVDVEWEIELYPYEFTWKVTEGTLVQRFPEREMILGVRPVPQAFSTRRTTFQAIGQVEERFTRVSRQTGWDFRMKLSDGCIARYVGGMGWMLDRQSPEWWDHPEAYKGWTWADSDTWRETAIDVQRAGTPRFLHEGWNAEDGVCVCACDSCLMRVRDLDAHPLMVWCDTDCIAIWGRQLVEAGSAEKAVGRDDVWRVVIGRRPS